MIIFLRGHVIVIRIVIDVGVGIVIIVVVVANAVSDDISNNTAVVVAVGSGVVVGRRSMMRAHDYKSYTPLAYAFLMTCMAACT